MISERKLKRFQFGLLLAAGALFAFYWFGYRSVSGWARALDKPATDAWKKLVAAAQQNPNVRTLESGALLASVGQMQETVDVLRQAGWVAGSRVALDAETEARVREEFQLLEFDRQRLQVTTALRSQAGKQKVVLADPALKGLPEFDPAMSQPSLLWAQLACAQQLLAAALAAQPRAVSNLTMLPVQTYSAGEGPGALLHQFRMRLELVGTVSSMMQFLRSLPLRENELVAAGLVAVPGKTQPFFVDRLILKNAPTALDEMSLEMVVAVFFGRPGAEVAK